MGRVCVCVGGDTDNELEGNFKFHIVYRKQEQSHKHVDGADEDTADAEAVDVVEVAAAESGTADEAATSVGAWEVGWECEH